MTRFCQFGFLRNRLYQQYWHWDVVPLSFPNTGHILWWECCCIILCHGRYGRKKRWRMEAGAEEAHVIQTWLFSIRAPITPKTFLSILSGKLNVILPDWHFSWLSERCHSHHSVFPLSTVYLPSLSSSVLPSKLSLNLQYLPSPCPKV